MARTGAVLATSLLVGVIVCAGLPRAFAHGSGYRDPVPWPPLDTSPRDPKDPRPPPGEQGTPGFGVPYDHHRFGLELPKRFTYGTSERIAKRLPFDTWVTWWVHHQDELLRLADRHGQLLALPPAPARGKEDDQRQDNSPETRQFAEGFLVILSRAQ